MVKASGPKKSSKKSSKKSKAPNLEPVDDDDREDSELFGEEEEPEDTPEGDGDEEVDEDWEAGGAEGDEEDDDDDEDEEDEDDEGDEEDDEARAQREAKKAAKKRSRERSSNIRKCKSAKSKGYRRLSLISLTGSKKGSIQLHNRPVDTEVLFDVPTPRAASSVRYKNAFTLNAVNRFCRFMPENVSHPTYTESEFKIRTKLHNESLGCEAANVIRANVEPVMHKILTQVILNRWDVGGKPRIAAYDIHCATRALLPHLDVSASCPIGIIRHAQMTPEPKFETKWKMVSGEKKAYKVPKDPDKKILSLPVAEFEQTHVEINKVKELRQHFKSAVETKRKLAEARKLKKKGASGESPNSGSAATGGEAVASIV